MPFGPFQSNFDAETLGIFEEAFDLAWSEVAATSGVMADQQTARNLIARRIVVAWRDHGERDPQRLKSYAIRPWRLARDRLPRDC